MKITQEIRDTYGEEAQIGMDEKAREFRQSTGEVYQ
jgi:hypothetical protein